MNTTTRQMMTLAALALTTAACSEPEVQVEEPELNGKSYELTSAEGYTLLEDTTFILHFNVADNGDTYLSASAGCNSMEGRYTLDDDVLLIEEMATTDMWCSDELNVQEGWLYSFLNSEPTVAQSGEKLTMVNEDSTLTFLDQDFATPDLPLTAGTWTVDTLIADNAMTTVNLDEFPVMWFAEDGSVGFSSACTELEGEYEISGDTLTLSNVMLTLIECNDESVSYFDQEIYEFLVDGDFSFSIEAERLTIMQGAKGISASGG